MIRLHVPSGLSFTAPDYGKTKSIYLVDIQCFPFFDPLFSITFIADFYCSHHRVSERAKATPIRKKKGRNFLWTS